MEVELFDLGLAEERETRGQRGAYDLVGLLLREHDRRQGRALWAKYAAWLEGVELSSTAVTTKC